MVCPRSDRRFERRINKAKDVRAPNGRAEAPTDECCVPLLGRRAERGVEFVAARGAELGKNWAQAFARTDVKIIFGLEQEDRSLGVSCGTLQPVLKWL